MTDDHTPARLDYRNAPEDVKAVAHVLADNGYRFRGLGMPECAVARNILRALDEGHDLPTAPQGPRRYEVAFSRAIDEARRWRS